MGDFEIRPEGGSMAARNIPQDRQDAQMFLGLSQNPFIDPKRALIRSLELMGVDDPQGWLKQSSPPVPPAVFETLQKLGVDTRLIQRAIEVAQREDPQLSQGPNVQQMNGAMGVPEQAAA